MCTCMHIPTPTPLDSEAEAKGVCFPSEQHAGASPQGPSFPIGRQGALNLPPPMLQAQGEE